MLSVGLTGNIGCGKSTVAQVWKDLGARIIDADQVTRELLEPGSPVLDQVVWAFGEHILGGDGTLDRKKLADIVFSDESALSTLNSIVHPPTIRRIRRIIEENPPSGAGIVAVEAALIIECGRENDYDVIVLVHAQRDRCVEWVMKSRGLTRDAVLRITGSQMDSARKKVHADMVIENDGTLDELEAKAEMTFRELQRMEKAQHGKM